MTQQFHSWYIFKKKKKLTKTKIYKLKKDTHTLMLIAALFTRYGGNLRVCQQMNGPIGYVVYTHAHNEILLIHKKE